MSRLFHTFKHIHQWTGGCVLQNMLHSSNSDFFESFLSASLRFFHKLIATSFPKYATFASREKIRFHIRFCPLPALFLRHCGKGSLLWRWFSGHKPIWKRLLLLRESQDSQKRRLLQRWGQAPQNFQWSNQVRINNIFSKCSWRNTANSILYSCSIYRTLFVTYREQHTARPSGTKLLPAAVHHLSLSYIL